VTANRLAQLITHRRRAVLVVSTLVVLAGIGLAPVFQSKLLGLGYDTPGTESKQATELITARTGFTERDLLVISSDRYVATDAVFKQAVERAVAAVHDVDGRILVAPTGAAGAGVSPDRRVVTATIALRGDAGDRQDTSHDLQIAVDDAMAPGMHAGVTGSSPLLADLIHIEERDMVKAEVVGLPIAGLILLVAFGSLVAAGLPMLLALSGLLTSFGVIAGLMVFMDFNSFAESLMAMVGLAIGIDYSLLFVRRFREERAAGGDPGEVLGRTLGTAGRTIMFSGAILSTSLIPVVVTDLPFFGDTAIAVIVVVFVEVVFTLTLLPALLLTLGDRLDRFSVPVRFRGGTAAPGATSGWYRWAKAVMRRPWPVLAGGVAILLLAASPATGLKTGIDLNARAMKGEESVKPLTTLEQHFPAAALSPVEVVVRGDRSVLAQATRRVDAVLRSERRLADVRVQPIGADVSLLVATPTVGVDTNAAEALIRDLRRQLGQALDRAGPPLAHALVTGVTAETVDYTDETNRLTPWVIATALALAFVLLLTLFRSPLLATKAIVMNLLSIGAAFGLTVLVFQKGFGQDLLGFTSPGYIQSWTPLTLFMMLFGLSMDYEVFMVSRIREEWERTGDTREAVARGLQRTGGVVTSAATIMVAIFASFLLTSIPEMKQLGFGLAVAVLIDATIVRAMLVPAFMRIAGRWNWWMPRRLDRLLPKLEH
jgi:RND superfamily putative drug exporter